MFSCEADWFTEQRLNITKAEDCKETHVGGTNLMFVAHKFWVAKFQIAIKPDLAFVYNLHIFQNCFK